MSNVPLQILEMLLPVAEALGEELLDRVVFIGGSTTAFLITDPITRQTVRFTDDVDLVVHIEGKAKWLWLQRELQTRGFKQSMVDDLICRLRLGDLKVDIMPDDENILGFSNRWYREAVTHAWRHPLSESITIRLLTPVYFIATKLEAWLGRGNNDPLSSHDLEDIINLVDGRAELSDEVAEADAEVRKYIATQFQILMEHPDFDYAVQGNLQDINRTEVFYQRWRQIITARACS